MEIQALRGMEHWKGTNASVSQLFRGNVNTKVVDSKENVSDDGDSLSISATGIELSKEENQQAMMAQYYEQLEAGKAQSDAYEDMAKLMEIARRIANGDHVPAEDEKRLVEFNAKLYQAAKAASILNANKDPKHYKSMFEEKTEEERGQKVRELERENKSVEKTDTNNDTNSLEEVSLDK